MSTNTLDNATSDNSKSVELTGGEPFVLKGGGRLNNLVVSYETWGELSPSGDNGILLCHALTGNSHAVGWWDGLIGDGLPIDTSKYFVVCSNVLGGCDGTTGPSLYERENPESKRRIFSGKMFQRRPKGSKRKNRKNLKTKNLEGEKPDEIGFPTVTIRDMVRVQNLLADFLGVKSWESVIGGSMGGMQALEWGLMFPEKVKSIAPFCSTLAATPWQIAFSSVGRNAIKSSANPEEALAIARSLAMISYRSDELFQTRFDRDLVNPDRYYGLWDKFQVESYLKYQGEVLSRRFDPESYLILNKAMDLHDIGRNRGGIKKAAKMIQVPTLVLSVDSDLLYPVRLQKEMAELIGAGGAYCHHEIIESIYGHDGFLLEVGQVGEVLRSFLSDLRDNKLISKKI